MSSIDQTIQTLFNKLKERKEKVSNLRETIDKKWKTTASFKLIGSQTPSNIQTASEDALYEIATHLILINDAKGKINDIFEFKNKNIQGFSYHDWIDDIKKRKAMINIREEERQLAELELRLNGVLSPEERRRIEVELLAKELG